QVVWTYLRGDDDLLALTGYRLAQKLLRVPVAVRLSSVEEGDPEVEGRPDRRDRLLLVRLPPHGTAFELVAAERDPRDGDIGPAELPVLHRSLLSLADICLTTCGPGPTRNGQSPALDLR